MATGSRLSERIRKLNPSATLAITAKAKKLKSEGKDIVNFAAGEPDFDTPDFIKNAAIEAIKSGFTKYTPTTGTPELKKLISEKFKKDNGLSYAPNQIVVSCGAKHSIANVLLALIGKGDEVLIPAPYWVSYPEMVNLCEGVPHFIQGSAKNNFKITAGQLKENITPKTKLLIVNSPSNPTGCVYSKEELEAIAEICVKNNIFVLSDEIYEKLIYDGLKHISIAGFGKEIYDLTVTVNGLSKSFSMTGWRIGYLGAPPEIAGAISNLQDHTTSNPASISQKAAEAALSAPDEFCKNLCAEFQKRRDYLVSRLKKMDKLACVTPQGAFYVFCDISKTKMPPAIFAERLLEEKFVSLIPGESFGADSWVRISFATSIGQIEKGMDRIEEWLA
jgi:aspartate aminotransferase